MSDPDSVEVTKDTGTGAGSTVVAKLTGKPAEQWQMGLAKSWQQLAHITATGFMFVMVWIMFFMQYQDRGYYQGQIAALVTHNANELRELSILYDKRMDKNWEAIGKLIEGINAINVGQARIEGVLRVPIDERKHLPATEPPKKIEVTPPPP